jgi:nucleoside-diphosphate-sugar epimerase
MRAIIPTIIGQIATGEKEIKLGDLTPTRDFNYVKDTCKGFLAIARSNDTAGKEINIASNSEISIKDTLELIATLMESDVKFVQDEDRLRPANSEVFRLYGDNTLIKNLTDFEPETSLASGLKETIDWFVQPENLSKYKTDIYNI